jgi:hypothetical protein
VVLADNCRVRAANKSFYEVFRVSPEVTLERPLYSLGDGQWDIPVLRAALRDLAFQGTAFEDLAVEHEFPNIGLRRMVLNGRRLDFRSGSEPLILLAIEEIASQSN